MKFLNLLVATSAVLATAPDGYCYYSPSVISSVNSAVGGLLGVVGFVLVAGVKLTVGALAEVKGLVKNNCAYGNYYGQPCYRCSKPLLNIPEIHITADVDVNVKV